MRVRVDVNDGLQRFGRELRLREERITHAEPAFEAVADDFLDVEGKAWETQGRSLGRAWKPLNPTYAREKAKKYPGAGILERDGRLRRSLSERGATYQRREVHRVDVRMGTTLGIAGLHQKGGQVTLKKPNRTVTIPQRKFVVVRKVDRARWVGLLAEWLRTGRPPHAGDGV